MTAFRFVEREKANHRVSTMCQVLGVSASGFWAWLDRPPSARAVSDAVLSERIRAIHARSRGTYGAPRVHAELAALGEGCGRKRVARLMRGAGITGVHRRRYHATTVRDPGAVPATDLVQRDFRATGPDRLWVADITALPTAQGFLYLAMVLDAWSRRVVGWSMDPAATSDLVTRALDMAIAQRRPAAGLVHHSDHGTQYTSTAVRRCLQGAGISASMGTIGDSYDNAMAESFFASLETELIDRSDWRTHAEARAAVFDWLVVFYDRQRRHSALGYLCPEEFERRYRPSHTTKVA